MAQSINKLIDKKNIDRIKDLMKANNGYITSKLVTEIGIHRMYLKLMLERGKIKKVATGVYIDPDKESDKYFVFAISTPKAIISHMSALYLLGYAKEKDILDITVSNNYFNYRLQECNMFFVNNKLLKFGTTKVRTPLGNRVTIYDLERCICDIIRSRKRFDLDVVKSIVKKYINSENYDRDKLYDYADTLNVREEVINFINNL